MWLALSQFQLYVPWFCIIVFKYFHMPQEVYKNEYFVLKCYFQGYSITKMAYKAWLCKNIQNIFDVLQYIQISIKLKHYNVLLHFLRNIHTN